MQDTQVYLNGFKVKEEFLPKQVFKFLLYFFDEDENERFRIIKGKYNGVPLNSVKEPVVEVASWKKPETPEVKEYTTLSLQDLPLDKQEELILLYLKKEIKIINKLRKYLPLPRKEYNGSILVIPDIKKLALKKVNNSFYVFFDIGYHIRSQKSIYDLVKEGKITYQELEGRELIYDPYGEKHGKRSIVTVVDIELNPDKRVLEKTVNHLINKYGQRNLSLNVPLIYIQFRGNKDKKYPTLPQYCYLERRDFTNKLVISNKKRKEILEKLANKVDFLENTPLLGKGKEYNNPQYIVKTKEGKLRKVNKLRETVNYPALFTPKELQEQKEIPVFVLVDKELPKEKIDKFLTNQLKNGYLKLNKESNPIRFKTLKSSNKELTFQVDFENFKIPTEIQEALQNYPLSFALCISKEMLEDNYDKAKRKLFMNNILSQFVIYEKWKNSPQYISQTLAFDIYSKLGIRLFTLAEKLPYDLIVGIDVGNDRFNRRSKAGSVTVFLSNGIIKTMFPLSTDTGGEKIDLLGELLEILVEKLNIENQKILILRDGNIYRKELESLASSYITREKSLIIDIVNVKKNHSFRILSDFGRKAVVLNNNIGILLPHSIDGAKSLLIDMAYSVKQGKLEKLPITYSLLSVLYKLTKVNLSTIFRENCMLRLPAPLHYSDMLVKALGRNWIISEKLLSMGCLYFI